MRDEGYMKIAATTIRECLADAGVAAGDVAHFAMPAPLARVNRPSPSGRHRCRSAGLGRARRQIGDLGSAQPLAMLDIALRAAAPGALILVAAFGSGCDVLLLRRATLPCPGAVPATPDGRGSYMKYLSFTGQIDSPGACAPRWTTRLR